MLVFNVNEASAKKQTVKSQMIGEHQNRILLENFPADTDVFYTILADQTVLAEGNQKTDQNGLLKLKLLKTAPSLTKTIVYDFKIENNGDYFDILMKQDIKSGKIRSVGRGLDQFSDIKILSTNKAIMTKADWSGAFAKDFFAPTNKETENTFEIALYGFENIDNLTSQKPYIIKVLQAPGGGLLSDTPNLPPTLSPPVVGGRGSYPLSTSNAGHLKAVSAKIVENYVTALMLMTEQLSVVMMDQMHAIGHFFDAKVQMETQRTYQELTAKAVKDYHPGVLGCEVGTYVRSLAKTDARVTANKLVLNEAMMARYRNEAGSTSAPGINSEMQARLRQYREVYCNPKDNNLGLEFMCEHDQDGNVNNSTIGAAPDGGIGVETANKLRINKDIDYARTIAFPLTVDVDMTDGVDVEDEEDVIALAKNLYWPSIVNYGAPTSLPEKANSFLDMQRVIALKNVAHNSYTNLVGLKSRAETPASAPGPGEHPGWSHMKTLLRDFGITDDEIVTMLGEEPSYWAQMDVLTKKMYQLPSFYTNLYDKPANVDRMSVALDAFKLMQMRDHYNSQLRHEMLKSGLVEAELVLGNHYSEPASTLLFGTR
ncbi:MAG: hypothetical protein AB8B83_01560 [Bdellovibrionales bacterium]